MSTLNKSRPVPPELVYEILKDVLRDYLHHFILDEKMPSWDAVKNVSLVSHIFHDTSCKILDHAFELDDSKNLQRAHSVLDVIRKHARDARNYNHPDRFQELVRLVKRSTPWIAKNPFLGAYLAYLDCRKLVADFENKSFVDERFFPPRLRRVVTAYQNTLLTALCRCNLVVPSDFSDCIGRLLAEQHWLLDAFYIVASHFPVIRNATEALMNDKCPEQMFEGLLRIIACPLNDLVESLARMKSVSTSGCSKYIRLYCISEDRLGILITEAFKACGLIPTLKKLVEMPMLESQDTFGCADNARLILKNWGAE